MSVSIEAERTLVKSPPELWSEVSDAQSLARHLDGLRQIRITRAEPETAVEWEADGASGSVRLRPSGFGTKVTLSLSRELPERSTSEPVIAETQIEPAAMASVAEPDLQPVAAEPAEPGPTTEPNLVEFEPTSETSLPDLVVDTPRQGFFARLFKRRHEPIASASETIDTPCELEPVALVEPEPMAVAEPESVAPVPESEETSEPGSETTCASLHEPTAVTDEAEQIIAPEAETGQEPIEPVRSVTADLATLEAKMAEQDEAMLTAMLDRLGAAHHRPFSRG